MTRSAGQQHLDDLVEAAQRFAPAAAQAERLGAELGRRLAAGARVLAAGNGGSAAEAQHFTAELVGRYRRDRRPVSAIALHADTSSMTAILNDYVPTSIYARQVQAHGRDGDVLVVMSTSGSSANILAAAHAARECGVTTWALTGRAPNPLADVVDEAITVPADTTATVQELHLAALHIMCEAAEQVLLDELADVVTA